ncbi:helix-turn-helix domain-containing protein [Nostoc sp. CHAB 5834]|nr:helix-turn-helix domain-containing protein [Nostoc sp. CHAB 5834]
MKINQKLKTPETVAGQLVALGAALRGYRMIRRLTHEEVAEACDFSRQTLSRIERGDASVSIGQVVRYAEVVGAQKAFSLRMPSKVDESQRRVRRTRGEFLKAPRPIPVPAVRNATVRSTTASPQTLTTVQPSEQVSN